MIRVYVAIVRKFVNQDLTRILGNIFSQIEALTDGTVWTRTLLMMHPTWTVSKIDWIKLDAQGWVSSWSGPLNPRPCHVGWPQDKAAQGKHIYCHSTLLCVKSYVLHLAQDKWRLSEYEVSTFAVAGRTDAHLQLVSVAMCVERRAVDDFSHRLRRFFVTTTEIFHFPQQMIFAAELAEVLDSLFRLSITFSHARWLVTNLPSVTRKD